MARTRRPVVGLVRAAAIILAVRGFLAGLIAIVLLLNAAPLWPGPTPPSSCSNCPTDLDAHTLMARQFLAFGLLALAIAVPSLLLALVTLTGRTPAVRFALVGEASFAAALVCFAGWAVAQRGTSVAAMVTLVLVVTSIPAEVLLITHLRRT